MKLRMRCDEATALMLAREDRHLPLWQQLALRAHLAACRACPVVERQLLTMRRGFKAWRDGSISGPD